MNLKVIESISRHNIAISEYSVAFGHQTIPLGTTRPIWRQSYVLKQFANVSQQSCTREEILQNVCKRFDTVRSPC